MACLIAKFDSYKRFEIPQMFVCSPGCICRDGLLTTAAGVLENVEDMELIPTFNAVSELNFRVYRMKDYDTEEEAQHFDRLFRSLKRKRLLYLDGIGFFMVRGEKSGYSGGLGYKDINAGSCELELQEKQIPYIENGTYPFFTGITGEPGLLEMLVRVSPLWTIGHVDETVASRYRTFEDVDISSNVLGFMLEQMQDAYECLFSFDIINRVINVYDQAEYVRKTDIHITREDLINTLEVDESSDDLYTAISVTGNEELGINAVNPLGTNVIYRFDYYLDWMSDRLRERVSAWQSLVDSVYDQYYAMQLARYESLTQMSALQAERSKREIQLSLYKRCKENMVAEANYEDIAAYNAVIIEAGGIPIPENLGYTWVKFADDAYGTNLTEDPYGKNYIGLAYDRNSKVPSHTASDYTWYTFRNGESFSREKGGETVYTWVVFADSVSSGMSNDPDGKKYIGLAEERASAVKSGDYKDYTWSLINTGNTGVPQVLNYIIMMVEQAETDVAEINEQVEALQVQVDARSAAASAIHAQVAMKDYFTAEEMDELSNYICEGSFTDEYVTITESMDYTKRFAQMKLLYDRAKKQLERISEPTQQITVDVENFIFAKEFEAWSDQLETGCIINVEVEEGDVAEMFLSSFAVNYTDKKLTMTFGNRYNRFDPKALFDGVLGEISKTSNTLSYVKDTIYPMKSGEFNAMKEALDTSRTLSKNAVLSSDNEQVIIDDTGYTGRRQLPDGTIDPKQIKINGRNIVFTDDAWETCKTAIGELVLADGLSAYGINAEVLLGNIIMGNELHILDSNGNDMFQVTENAIMARVGDSFAAKSDTISGVDVEYCRASSSASPLDESTITAQWSTVAPEWVNGEYVWQRTVTTFDDGEQSVSSPTCISGAHGQDGTSGVGIASSEVRYAVSESGTSRPTGSDTNWQEDIPEIPEGSFLWTRTRIVYTDGRESVAYTVSGAKGKDGTDGKGIVSSEVRYAVSNNQAAPPENGWEEAIPEIPENHVLWSRTRVIYTDGTDAVSYSVGGINGENGHDGVGIARTEVDYVLSESSDAPPADGWDPSVPAVPVGSFLWTRTKLVYTNNTESVSYTVSGADGTNGTDGVGIESTEVSYALSESSDAPPETGWDPAVPPVPTGSFLWTRTKLTYTDGAEYVSYTVSGADGADGIDGIGIESTTIFYMLSEDGSTPPTQGWSDQFPTNIGAEKYLWVKTVILYSDGETIESYSVSGNGTGISQITEEYYLSSSDTAQENGNWSTSPPVWSPGMHIWTRSRIQWDNGIETTTAPVLDNTWNQMGATLDTCVTDVNINKRGIEQNTAFYRELYGMVAKINAYIQTGVISTDEETGKTSFGVKIGENFASTDAYIVSGATAFSSGWLSDVSGGAAITPQEAVIYTVKTPGTYYGKYYRWNGTAYEETASEGTLSSIFTSSELGFYDTGEKTAYFSNKNLNVRTVRTNKILLSEDVISDTSSNNWQIGIDNGFYLKWVGSK